MLLAFLFVPYGQSIFDFQYVYKVMGDVVHSFLLV